MRAFFFYKIIATKVQAQAWDVKEQERDNAILILLQPFIIEFSEDESPCFLY